MYLVTGIKVSASNLIRLNMRQGNFNPPRSRKFNGTVREQYRVSRCD